MDNTKFQSPDDSHINRYVEVSHEGEFWAKKVLTEIIKPTTYKGKKRSGTTSIKYVSYDTQYPYARVKVQGPSGSFNCPPVCARCGKPHRFDYPCYPEKMWAFAKELCKLNNLHDFDELYSEHLRSNMFGNPQNEAYTNEG